MEFINTALIQEEVLLNVGLVIEHGWPVGPSFMHALGTLTEALVIHDKIYFDPLNYLKRDDLNTNDIHSIIRDLGFVQQLMSSNALTLFPDEQQVDEHLAKMGDDYRLMDFMLDYTYDPMSFMWSDPSGEKIRYESLIDLMKIPQIFSNEDNLVPVGGIVTFTDPSGLAAMEYGFTAYDLRTIVCLNKRAKGYFQLAKHAGLNFYPTYVALPHQINAVKTSNSKARELYETVIEKVTSTDEDSIGDDEFSRIPIPPLLQLALSNCKDSPTALPAEIYELRHKFSNFRKYLTDYERAWNFAKTRSDRLKLRTEFQNAWQALTNMIEKPSTRITYTLWDILKSPLGAPIKIGDKLAEKGRELYSIGRVRGLYDFWRGLTQSPIPERNKELVSGLFRNLASDQVWHLAEQLAQSVNSYLTS